MTCRQCGIDIADKALICYRCGTATTDPKFKPYVAPARGVQSSLAAFALVLAALLLLGFVLTRTALGAEYPRLASGIAVAFAVVVVTLRAYFRRR